MEGIAMKLLTTKEAAAYFQVSPRTLEDWRYKQEGPDYITLTDKTVRYRESALERFLDQHTTKAA
jgi:predicted DNA-binding transcriptional regulator AlpA